MQPLQNRSLETLVEQVRDPRSRAYMREVLSSYQLGNHRSAVVMLWTVVVCDLMYKLRELRDLFQDTAAKALLAKVTDEQARAPKGSQWELTLVECIAKQTPLIEAQDLVLLKNLQQLRHLSAHPILSETTELLSEPSREQTRALLFVALDAVLLKNPALATNFVEGFIQDIASVNDTLATDEHLQRYLRAKWCKYTTRESRRQLLRAMWKFCFRLIDTPSKENRNANFRALSILASDYRDELRSAVLEDQSHFSNIANAPEPLYALALLLASFPELYEHLAGHAQALLQSTAQSDFSIQMVMHYLSATPDAHFDGLMSAITAAISPPDWTGLPKIDTNTWSMLREWAIEHDVPRRLVEVATTLYVKSSTFSQADSGESCVRSVLELFTADELRELLEKAERNDQTYRRSKCRSFHDALIKRTQELLGEWPDKTYPNITKRSSHDAV